MTRHLDLDRAIEEWLSEGPSQLPDRAIDAIVHQLDTTTQRKYWWLPRREQMNRMTFALGGAAAAVVVAVLALGLYYNQPGAGGQPTPSASPMHVPIVVGEEGSVALEPGWYYVNNSDGYRFTFRVPAAGFLWTGGEFVGYDWQGGADGPEFAALAFFGDGDFVYRDPCQWSGTEASTGDTAADFANAIAAVGALSPSTPADITIDGYQGKRIRISAQSDVDFADCDEGQYRSWANRYHQGPGQVDEMRILDLEDGDRIVVVLAYLPATPDDVVQQLEEMVGSLQIEPTGR